MEESKEINRITVNPRPRELSAHANSIGADAARPSVGTLLVLWRGRWVIITCVVVGLICGAIYLAKATPVYTSASVVYVQSMPKIMNDDISRVGSSAGYLFTQCQVITSTTILTGALDVPGVSEAKCLQGNENPVGFLKNAVVAAPTKQGDLINVMMESPSPQDAALIVNGVVQSYIDYVGKQHRSTAIEVLRIFEKEMERRESELKATNTLMATFKKNNPDLALQTDRGSIYLSRLTALADALTTAELRELDLKTAVAQANLVQNDPNELRRLIEHFQLTNESDTSVNPQLFSEYQQDRRQLQDLLDRLGPQHTQVVEAEKHLSRLEAELNSAAQRAAKSYIEVLNGSLEICDRRVKELQAKVNEERQAVLGLNSKQAEYEQYVQDAQRIQRSMDILDTRMKEVNVTEDVGALSVSVLETAKPNYGQVRPKQTTTMGVALIAGLVIGVGGALLRDVLDQRVRSAEEISSLLGLSVVGAVPHILGKGSVVERGQEIQLRPRSDVAEAYRTIRTGIFFGLSGAENNKTILVTSPAPGDGKTTLISNLAIAVAQGDRRTLLIDADCRRPMQHKIFKLSDKVGLTSVLNSKATLAEAIQKSGIANLDVLACGPLPQNPAEMLDSPIFLDLLRQVKGMYDQVLIDSPPVMPVTDARVLSASCDATLLVLRADKSTRRLAEHARNALLSVGAGLLGVVVNDVPRGKDGYGYYYYGYSYGYTQNRASSNGNGSGNGHQRDEVVVVAEGRLED